MASKDPLHTNQTTALGGARFARWVDDERHVLIGEDAADALDINAVGRRNRVMIDTKPGNPLDLVEHCQRKDRWSAFVPPESLLYGAELGDCLVEDIFDVRDMGDEALKRGWSLSLAEFHVLPLDSL